MTEATSLLKVSRITTDLQLGHFNCHVGLVSKCKRGRSERTLGINLRFTTFCCDAVSQYLSFASDVVILQMRNSELVICVLVQLFTKYKATYSVACNIFQISMLYLK